MKAGYRFYMFSFFEDWRQPTKGDVFLCPNILDDPVPKSFTFVWLHWGRLLSNRFLVGLGR
jgi:hypothetical protein